MQEYVLQNRWVLEGNALYYYGLRNKENMFRNTVRLTKAQQKIIASLPSFLTDEQKKALGALLGTQVVLQADYRPTPKSLMEARFCTACAANDFIIPGLEFDTKGRCPMCQTADEVKHLRSVVPVLDEIPRAKKSRFDVAVFYTGGKDSTFLLYHLAMQKGLRVLALTWEIPFMSDSARASIQNAKKHFSNVEFITRSVSKNDLDRIYRKLYELSGNTCACPSLAYLLFYPELVQNRVPYFVVGNEPVQMLGLYYNHMAPKFAYKFAQNKPLAALINIGRLLILRPPLKKGQLQTLLTMKQLAYGDHPLKKLSGYSNPLVSNVVTAIHEVPELLPPFRRSIRYSSRTGNIPAFVHLDFDRICGGVYDWNAVKDTLIERCGWVAPDEGQKALHTSCSIERCKDHSQFVRFYRCQSKMIPFSAIEVSLASRSCGRSRDEMLYEMEHLLGFSLDPIPECAIMCGCIGEEI
ncbi:MAG: hypothetical protein IJW70_02325 [Clostridia bacterium]|nr:hypothetical protein [Clostridia bacterium]